MSAEKFKIGLTKFIDFFYPPFKWLLGPQTFRYLFCGGSNAVLNITIFSLCYNFVFLEDTQFWNMLITRYAKAYTVALCFSFPIGFVLLKNIVFPASNLETKTQLSRYGFVTVSSITFDYLLLYLLIGVYNLPATLAQASILVVLSLYSYLCQTYFTFITKKAV